MSKLLISLTLLLLVTGCSEKENVHEIHLINNPPTTELFGGGIISTGLYERDIAISAEGDEIFYTLGDTKQKRRFLMWMRLSDGQWSDPDILNISGTYQDIEPFLAHDGNSLYFASDRPMEGDSLPGDYNIWYSVRNGELWDKPVALDTTINTESDEFYPSLSANGNLYFTATRENGVGREDIFLAEWRNKSYQPPVPLDSTINTNAFEFNAYINPEEDLLIFSSYGRADGMGGGDLYYSWKNAEGHWNEARNMGPEINSESLDYCPFIDWPRKNFFYTSEAVDPAFSDLRTFDQLKSWAGKPQNGFGDIYRVGLDNLDLKN